MGRSPSKISPAVMSIRPAMRFRVVVLPQPDGPTRATNSPSSTSSETRSTATTSPYVLVTSRSVTPAIAVTPSSLMLDRTLGKGAHEVPLQHKEEHDHRHTHDERGRHESRPVGGIFREELLETNRHRHQLLRVDERPGIDVLVPALDEGVDCGRYQSRRGKRQDDLPERLKPGRSVDSRRAFQFGRNIVVEAFEEPDRKWETEREIGE